MSTPTFTRRKMLALGAAGTAVFLTEGCGFFDTDADTKKDNSGGGGGGADTKESPMLAEQVKAGKLPPLEERLPGKPTVLTPFDQPGLYGGTLRQTSPGKVSSPFRGGLIDWDPKNLQPAPAMAESWDVSSDGRVYTIHLRQGLKWSDGEPYTADDVEFAMDAYISNTTLRPAFPNWMASNGKPATFKKVDELTVEFTFTEPNGLFPRSLAFASSQIVLPKHYLQQFHPDYADPKKVDEAAKAAQFATWDQYFTDRKEPWTNTELPVANPWIVVNPVDDSGSGLVEMDRNPYYWKVDNDGRQLPYIDHFTVDIMAGELSALRAANGEIDLQATRISYKNIPVLVESADEKGYTIKHWIAGTPWIAMHMNQSAKDPEIRKLMQSIDFRAGLSHALDRDEMNEALYAGQGGTQQPCGIPQDPTFVDGMGQTFIEFDEAEANSRLDKAGLTQRDADGMRLRPDGKKLELVIKTFEYETGVNAADAYNFVKKYWDKVGVRTQVKTLEIGTWVTDALNGDTDVAGYLASGVLWDVDAQWYVPTLSACYWAPLFGKWYETRGAEGEEPPANIKELVTLYDQLVAEVDADKRVQLGQEILKIHDENVFMIGTVTIPFWPVVVNADMVNVLDDAVESFVLGHEEGTLVEQVFYKDPDQH